MSTRNNRDRDHLAKKPRTGERTLLACIHCKQRKLKCDAQSPQCKNCLRTERVCLVEDPATGLHRPRDYMQKLEAKVTYLENLLQKRQREDSCDHHVSPSSEARDSSVENDQSPAGESTSNLDMLSSEVAMLCLNAAGREPQFFGSSSAVSFSRILGASLDLPLHEPGWSAKSQEGDEGQYSDRGSMASLKFPPPAKATMLSQAFFKSIHPQYPFLHRPTLLFMEQECLRASTLGDLTTVEPVSLFFVLMTYAIGCLALGQPETEAQEYFSPAFERIGPLLHMDGLYSVQALLCCAVYSIRSYNGANLWKLSGMAIRQCVELGYHRSTERYRPRADALTKELSKRCFWVAYDLDCVSSFILGRPKGIPDNAIDAELPVNVDDEDITPGGVMGPPQSSSTESRTCVTGFIHVIKLRQLWSKISDNLYPNTFRSSGQEYLHHMALVKSLRQEVDEWRAGSPTPDEVCTSNGSPLSVFESSNWFHIAYDYSILLLYRAQITSPLATGVQDPEVSASADAAFRDCVDSARDICIRYRRLYQTRDRRIQFTWGSLHILFLAGLTFIYCLWRSERLRQSTPQHVVISTCMACNTLLVIIAERWSQASSYRDIFESLSERTINMMSGNQFAAQSDDAAGSSSMQVADLLGPSASDTTLNPGISFGWMSGDQNYPAPMNLDARGLQEWIMDLDCMPSADDPHWFTQDLLNGMSDPPNNFAFNFQ